jgi:ABC-type branched-subunit amino acid transport system substrate-binding protein
VKYTNSHGGIGGHPLKFISCDGGLDPNLYISCAKNLASNSAVIASSDLGGIGFGQSDPVLAQADIGIVNSDAVTAPEFDAPNAVIATGGVPVSLGALVTYFARTKHVQKVAFTSVTGEGAQIEAIVASFAKPLGVTIVPFFYPQTTTDFTATALAISASGAGLVLGATPVEGVGSFLLALKAAGNTIPTAWFDTSLTPAAITQAGSAANGLYTTAAFPTPATARGTDATALADYAAGMKAYGQPTGTGSLQGWAVGLLLANLITQGGGGAATRASVLNVLQKGSFNSVPLFPAHLSRAPGVSTAPPVPSFAAMVNPSDFIGQYDNGVFEILPSVGRVNPFQA